MGYRITKVYTRQGDTGETRLGGGQKVGKDSTRIEAYGTVDELNSTHGIVLAFDPHPKIKDSLNTIQHHLFRMGGDLCLLEEEKQKWQVPVIEEKHVSYLEQLIDTLNNELEPLEEFILPRGTTAASFLHQARCVCRRAERVAVRLSHEESINPLVLKYLNRLSDALFVLARYENHQKGLSEPYWDKNR